MKKIFALLLTLIIMIPFASSCAKEEKGTSDIVKMEVRDFGTITLELYPEIAPITVENFKNLVKDGFYDGILFHRVISDFLIQAGDPTATGNGGSGKTIKGEFALNGVKNDLKHERGVISMARNSISYDSASSQFFIVQKDAPHLNGGYAAFGKVIEGMDVVDKIATVKTNAKDRPTEDVVIERMYFVEK